jgi:hypothetical protein
MHNDCVEVDELLLELADYKNDYADVAAERLLRKCSNSWELTSTYKTACTMHGSQTAHGSLSFR